MNDAWIADRMRHIDASGIRKAFDLAKAMNDPINLSIGLPDFDVPDPVKAAAIEAIERGQNAYTVTQGIPELRGKLQAAVDAEFRHADRQVLITSGTSGALLLALCCVVNPGDEVIIFDPYFVMYRNLVTLAGGTSVLVDTYPDFRIDAGRVEAAMTPRTKCVLVNSPANPTGVVASADEMRALAELCRRRGVLLISDEVYRSLLLRPPLRHAGLLERRGPGRRRLQQVARHDRLAARLRARPRPADPGDGQAPAVQLRLRPQHGPVRRRGRPRRRPVRAGRRLPPQARCGRGRPLRGLRALLSRGRLLRLPARPWGTATEFVAEAIRSNLLIIPGNVFSRRDTHFRISYAVDDATLARGLELLSGLAEARPQTASQGRSG